MTKLGLMTRGLLGASVISLYAASNAYAGGTAAGTSVENTFTLNYDVSGTPQTEIDNTGSPTAFTVDRLVDLTVASNGNANVAPGAQDQDLVFSLTNNGNDTQAYDFTLVNESGDDYNTTGLNITYYVDDGDGSFEPGTDDGTGTPYTPGSGDASSDLAADAIIWVVVDGDIPAARVDADTSDISLVSDTLEPTTTSGTPGAAVVADAGGNTLTGAAENVLADGSGTSNEGANAGDHSATGSYVVASADLTAGKTVTVFTQDGSGCTTIPGTAGTGDQYSVPGACVEYVISTTNTGASASATSLAISDVLADELEFINAASSGFTGGTFTQPATNTDCTGGACTVSLTGATLTAGSTGTITIRALVQ
jgi:hypothetical protein